jgi:hypothetical protein
MAMHIVVKFAFEGIHSWPSAPDEVSFLRNLHRHIFHVEAVKYVSHADREIEIIMLKREMQEVAQRRFRGPHMMSCEMMAMDLAKTFDLIRCTVLEDGENGAEVQT